MTKFTILLAQLAIVALALLSSANDTGEAEDGIWEAASMKDFGAGATNDPWIVPDQYRAFRLDVPGFKKLLAPFSQKTSASQEPPKPVITLPTPEGTYASFHLFETQVMSPGLSKKFPGIRTFRGVGVEDNAAHLRLTWSSAGMSAQILESGGAYYIDRVSKNDLASYACYRDSDYGGAKSLQILSEGEIPRSNRANLNCTCRHCDKEPESPIASASSSLPPIHKSSQQSAHTLKTYRLAVAATGEYTAFHSNSGDDAATKKAKAQAAIVDAINRTNGIFESELSIRFVLVENNDQLVFTDPGSDPFDNDNIGAMLGDGTQTINGIIGSENYDVGHIFCTANGGSAIIGAACLDNFKGHGVSGSTSPIGDSFWVRIVAHELGHQFGAQHSFNGDAGSCGGNREPSTAYEPGSGSTIMSYSGTCNSDNLQPNIDPFFNSGAYDQIQALLAERVAACAVTTSTWNSAPSVEAGEDHTIPANTPFELTASGSDPDPGDVVTYLWEQRDLGPSTPPSSGDNGEGPIFRVWTPTTSPTRVFPRLSDLLNNTTSSGENLPTTNRTLNFRVTARDNRAGGGGVSFDEMAVTVTTAAGPFRVTSPNSAESHWTNLTVTWDVANTTAAPVNTSHVDILLSTDGGNTYLTTLAANTPNDGSQTVVLPELITSTARIKIKASDGIFFDVSDSNFSISPETNQDYLTVNDVVVTEGNSGSTSVTFTVNLNSSPRRRNDVTVNYQTADGTAVAGQDYTATSGQLVFRRNTDVQFVTVNVSGDTVPEGDEQFSLVLSNATEAIIADSQGTASILNDDVGPPVIISRSAVSISVDTPFTYQIVATGNPTSFAAVTALPAGLSLDPSSGLVSGITPVTPGNYPVTLSATNAFGTGTLELVIIVGGDPVSDGLDLGNIVIVQGGEEPWSRVSGDNPTTYDGVDAAQSGAIRDGQSSWMETPLQGPDTLSFWWKVSTQENSGFLRCLLDGEALFTLTGEVGWNRRVVEIPPGPHTIRWVYERQVHPFYLHPGNEGTVDQLELASQIPQPMITGPLDVVAVLDRSFAYQIETTREANSFSATGLPSGLEIDQGTGLIHGIPEVTGVYQVTLAASNSQGGRNEVMTLAVKDRFLDSHVLDSPSLTSNWTSDGNATWFAQNTETHTGDQALQSGTITHNERSILQTTVKGPDILSFHWKVSSEEQFDYLNFDLDGSRLDAISGETSWEQRFIVIPEGLHQIQWSYSKDASESAGQDTGFLDNVSLVSDSLQVTSLEMSNPQSNEIKVTFPSEAGLTYSLSSSNDLETWTEVQSGIAGTGSPIEVTHTKPGSTDAQWYRVSVSVP